MQNSRDKAFALTLGILVSLVVLEVSLRVEGIVYSHWMRDGRPAQRRPGALVILCLGDSFTSGCGAPPGRDYPVQLEELFRHKYPQKKIQVINKGVGGFNSAEILERFDENVNAANPDMIVLLAGAANEWNTYGYGKYLNRNGWQERLNDLFYQVKTFKLIKLLLLDCRDDIEHFFKNNVFTPSLSVISPQFTEWGNKGKKCQQEGKYEEAILWYKKQVKNDSLIEEGFNNLISMYRLTGDSEGQRQMYEKLIALDPKNNNYLKLFSSSSFKNPVQSDEATRFLKKYVHKNPLAGDILKAKENWNKYGWEMKPWIEHDVEAMVRRAQKRGIQVILQDYPSYDGITPKRHYGFATDALREVAERNPVLFVDHERIFEGIFLKGERREDYFEPAKVHCNEKGYGVMAKNIYCGIISCNGFKRLLAVDSAEKRQCLESEARATLPGGKQS